jgi:lysylphosphatidylglycerol synthetase-like protein (DUF2156 family)
MTKRIKITTAIFTLVIMIGILVASTLISPARSNALPVSQTSGSSSTTNTVNCQAKPTFFGLLPWYQYLTVYSKKAPQLNQPVCEVCFDVFGNQSQDKCPKSSVSDISLVLLVVVDDLLRLAGLIAIGMVLYSSVKFITSQGEPEAVAQARTAIINALIGAAIALIAVVLVSFLGNVLGG